MNSSPQASPLLVKQDGSVRTLIINRPQKHNFLTPPLLAEMAQAIDGLKQDGNARVLIIRGAGTRSFSAGYDITALPSNTLEISEKGFARNVSPLEATLQAIETFPYPVIAMVNGNAFGGGCEMAVACDIRIGGRYITMGMPPAKLGIVYSPAGFRRFLRVLGFAGTLEIFLTGRRYDSRTCFDMGLLNHRLPSDELENFTAQMAAEISQNAPMALAGTKHALHALSRARSLDQAEEKQLVRLFSESLKSEDFREGKRAFAEKRKPRFKGR